jgi:exodeoxyribonuclease VII large subunit
MKLQQQSKYYVNQKRERDIHQQVIRLISEVRNFFRRKLQTVTGIEKNIDLLNPLNILKRGYSITLIDGKVLKTVEDVHEGTTLRTMLADGDILSTTKSVNKTESHE